MFAKEIIALLLAAAVVQALPPVDPAVEAMAQKAMRAYGDGGMTIYDDLKAHQKRAEPRDVILYLTASSVPPEHLIALLRETVREDRGGEIKVQPLFKGLGRTFFDYAGKLHWALEAMPPVARKSAEARLTPLRLDPALFKDLNISRVPVIVTARCREGESFSRCRLFRRAEGAGTLQSMVMRSGGTFRTLFEEAQ